MDPTVNRFDIAIVGGGASGLMAALSAARYLKEENRTARIAILEACDKVGKKLLATGNGRCNFTNRNLDGATPEKVRDLVSKRYHSVGDKKGGAGELTGSVITTFGHREALAFFESFGMVTVSDDGGRFYPYSQHSSSVLDILRLELEALRVHELCYYPIDRIERDGDMWLLHSSEMKSCAKRVIVASGGLSSPSYADGRSGYELLKSLGLKFTATFPALTQIKCDSSKLAALKGVRHTSKVSIIADGRTVKAERGELQFADGALSGICVFELSRLVSEYYTCGTVDGKKVSNIEVSVDLLPSISEAVLSKELKRRISQRRDMPIEKLFTGIFHKNLGQAVIKSVYDGSLARMCSALDNNIAEKLAYAAKNMICKPSGVSPWQSAQVTAGGLSQQELNPSTLETRFEGLYVTGELIDVDGDCGGYNLQWAWSSGYVAGRSAAMSLLSGDEPISREEEIIPPVLAEKKKRKSTPKKKDSVKKEPEKKKSSRTIDKRSVKKVIHQTDPAPADSTSQKSSTSENKTASKSQKRPKRFHVPVEVPKAKPIPTSTGKPSGRKKK
ncbi:MAG: aminoacetone oxidase family FAD-binding enzyme [Clostridiales bacterium]|nr:aminoacetone oxidase family FAD-binding enzyme [Clostridiales bacterium]